MITRNEGFVTVAGPKYELMLFYCAWQSYLWPEWMSYEGLGKDNDEFTRHYKLAVESIQAGELKLFNAQTKFQEALEFAIKTCKRVDMKITRKEKCT